MKISALILAGILFPAVAFAQDVQPGQAAGPAITPAVTHDFVTAYPSAGASLTQAQPACGDLSDSTSYCNSAVGQLPGNTSNSMASAGNIGELMGVFVSQNNSGTATFTNGSAVISVATWATNTPPSACFPTTGATCIQPVYFTTTGGLPTNFTANTVYYIDPASYSGTNFKVATTVANAIAGTDIVAGSAGTGTQTAHNGGLLSSGSSLAVAAINLTAGQWSCKGIVTFNPNGATTTTLETATIAGVAGNTAISVINAAGQSYNTNNTSFGAGLSMPLPILSRILFNSGAFPIYLNATATFATNTNEADGSMTCIRQR